ncbi:hypothetical protein V8B97DRAFT_2080137 [Scleroderma yunnanense]
MAGEGRRRRGAPFGWYFKVRWGNWSREDGSNTTWQTEIPDRPDLVNRWKRIQRRKRAALADEGLDMDVRWPDHAIHLRLTHQRAQGYEEKKQRSTPIPSTANWDQEVENAYQRRDERSVEDGGPHLRVRRTGSIASIASQRGARTASPAQSITSRDTPFQSSPSVIRKKGRLHKDTPSTSSAWHAAQSSSSIPLLRTSQPPHSVGPSTRSSCTLGDSNVSQATQSVRSRIEAAWSTAAADAMAAEIRIDENIADEDIPSDLKKFTYVEKGYLFDDGLQEVFQVSPDVFTTCDHQRCLEASDCPCQVNSEILDASNRNRYAYCKGLFTFNVPRGAEVIECNKYCSCGRTCPNRVVQKSRDIGIEIFDTKRCGWGARTLTAVPKGKVMGTYTGRLIRREDIDTLPNPHLGYLFDLDCTEVKDDENLGDKYTVDSYTCGNWTRFVNHSCDPNMAVFSVVYDTIPIVNMPYVSFVACEDIPAHTELTIDYQPYWDEDIDATAKHGTERCKCGSQQCRGWYRM